MATVGMWPSSEADVVDRVMAAVGRRTRLVVVDHVASPTGFVFPIRRLAAAAHDRGVPLLVDAAHAPGQVEVAVDADGADFWVGNLHKWVCSPRAAAVLVVTPPWRQVVRPLVASHGFFDGMQPAFDWTGTADPTPLLAVPAALRFWQDQGGWDIVRERQRGLVQAGAEAVVAAVGGRVGPEPPFAAAMRSVTLPAPLSVEAGAEVGRLLLVDHGVEAVAMSFAGQGWIRMCGQVYNEASDYDRLAAALPTVLDQVESTGSIGSRNSSRLPNGSQA
jgi:isopenicillin-N epimerase